MNWVVLVHVSHILRLAMAFRPQKVLLIVPLLSIFTATVAQSVTEGPVCQRVGNVMAG